MAEEPPQYSPNPAGASEVGAVANIENLQPVLVKIYIAEFRTEIFYDKYGVWASKIQPTKRTYVVDLNRNWSYDIIQKRIRVSIAESKDRPTGFLASAGIQVAKFEKLSVLWDGGNGDWTEMNDENCSRLLKLMDTRGWRDVIRVTYKDLGILSNKVMEQVEKSNAKA